jgi:hypothetical protein
MIVVLHVARDKSNVRILFDSGDIAASHRIELS